MSARAVRAALLVALVAAPGTWARQREQPQPRIEISEARREGGSIRVAYRILDLLPEEVLDRIHSGIPLRFRHRIEVLEKRPGLFAADRVHARAILELGVAYDSLTQRYELVRSLEVRGRPRSASGDPLEQRSVVDSEGAMRRWLTEVQDLSIDPPRPVPSDPPPTVRIEVVLGRRWVLLVIPTTETVTAEHELGLDG